jgi:hypothetical protein
LRLIFENAGMDDMRLGNLSSATDWYWKKTRGVRNRKSWLHQTPEAVLSLVRLLQTRHERRMLLDAFIIDNARCQPDAALQTRAA